jgi:hypothetical protein
MARSSECTGLYAQKVLDTADIVREAMFQQQPTTETLSLVTQIVSDWRE